MKVKPEWVTRFQAEATAHLEAIQTLTQALNWQPGRPPLLDEEQAAEDEKVRQLFIKAHSIKGTAGMIGLMEISGEAARLESLWGAALEDRSQRQTALQQQAAGLAGALLVLVQAIQVMSDER